MSRARVPEAALSALAVLVACWPMSNLIDDGRWLPPVVLLLVMVLVLGCAGRRFAMPAWAIALVQVAGVVLATALLRLNEHLAPTDWGEIPGAVDDLLADAGKTLTTYAAPAPLSPGVLFLLTLCIPLIAVVVDLLSASLRLSAVAGLPLLAVFLFSTANTNDALNPVYFLALAAVWLGMLLQQALRSMRSWASAEAYARTPERADDRLGLGAFSATARWMGAVTLLLAVAIPVVIPHLPTQYLADGLARRQQSTSASVGFTDTLNLAKDLNDRSQTPILTYATTDPTPPPLKVLTVSRYQSDTWVRDDPARRVDGSDGNNLPEPPGLARRTGRQLERINVVGNGLDRPYLAAPWPVRSADLKGRSWYFDPEAVLPRARDGAPEYTITYASIDADARPTSNDGSTSAVPSDTLAVHERSRPAVERAVRAATEGQDANTPFDKAIAFQDWLRDPENFTYSLTLASRRTGEDGQQLDALSNFLATRRGYCTQFATAMVMMARTQGIPARVAVGFLPGTQTGSSGFQVRAADAHAWPELYFPGMGWTRFEPTPGARSGEVPSYTLPNADGPSTRATQGRPEDNTATTTAPTTTVTSSAAPSAAPVGQSDRGMVPPTWLWWVLAALVLGGAGAAIIPMAARWRREQAGRSAERPQEQVEVRWAGMESRLRDLGIDGPGDRSPRQIEQFYRRRAPLEADGKAALHRATQTLERSRYAGVDAAPEEFGDDLDHIVREVREQAALPARVSAALFPRTGREAIGEFVLRILRAPARLFRRHNRS